MVLDDKVINKKKLLIDIKNVKKSFSGITVFSDFDFDIYSGEAHCICGENGAGKSTFIKILSGAYQPDQGDITIDGKKIDGKLSPSLSMQLGIQTIYQEHTLMQHMTVLENLFVGREVTSVGVINKREMYKQSIEVLSKIGITNINPAAKVRDLATAQKKFVEIARAFVKEAKIIIMDEPTASFSANEIEQLLKVVEHLKNAGVGVIYISHHLEEIFYIADRVTVIRDGKKIRTYLREEINEANIINDMVGREASLFYKREPIEIGEEVMEVKNISGAGANDVSFKVHKGEIIGISGLLGAGRTEFAEILFGRRRPTAGSISINGKTVNIKKPSDAVKAGMCFITEDRQMTGLFLGQSISLNIILVHSVKYNTRFMRPKNDKESARVLIHELRIRCLGPEQQVRYLSGGNQQKVVLSKWFNVDGEIFIFDEPTKGVDIGAKEEIYALMLNLCRQGKAILMISSDMPEIVAMSDRVLIMKDGAIQADVQKENINSETILSLALGGVVSK